MDWCVRAAHIVRETHGKIFPRSRLPATTTLYTGIPIDSQVSGGVGAGIISTPEKTSMKFSQRKSFLISRLKVVLSDCFFNFLTSAIIRATKILLNLTARETQINLPRIYCSSNFFATVFLDHFRSSDLISTNFSLSTRIHMSTVSNETPR